MEEAWLFEAGRVLLKAGARAAGIDAADISFDASFRALCEQNACGYYGRCWACPPDVGAIETLIARAQAYERALVFQTVHPLADAYDIEGMHEASIRHNRLTKAVGGIARAARPDCLVLGAGACGVCARCARQDGQPCRLPGQAIISLEACGIDVSALARACGLSYTGGENTVTYFSAVLFHA